jgi:hypothetical protein
MGNSPHYLARRPGHTHDHDHEIAPAHRVRRIRLRRRRALFGKFRRRQMGDEVPDSLRALGALLARPSAVGTMED